jgi:outer membrane protein
MSMAKFRMMAIGLSIALGTAVFGQGAATPATAATPEAPAPTGPVPTKIGVVNIQQAIAECAEGKKEIDALQQKFNPKQAELKNMNDEVEGLKKQYQAQADKLSDDEKNSRAKVIDTKQKSMQRNYEDFQGEVQAAEQEVINRIGSKMVTVLEKYASANGYAVVLDVSNPQTSPVLWATQASVITKELVDAYDKENPAGVSAPAPKPAGSAGTATRPPAAPSHAATPAPTPKKP